MTSNGFEVEGRKFRIRADYEAALRDKALIDQICTKVNLNNKDDVLNLYYDIQNENIRFESLIGQDFDDRIYELVQSIHNGSFKDSNISIHRSNQRVYNKKKTDSTISFDDLNQKLKNDIIAELKIREIKRKIIIFTCSSLAILCLGYFILYNFYIERTERSYLNLVELKDDNDSINSNAYFEETIVHKTENNIDVTILDEYEKIYNKNKSLIGWLKIADTNIDYPVMQTSNNEYYLDHNLNQKYDKNGSIFMDKDCDVLKPSTNLIIYGHHMKSGKMFGDLNKYSNESYYKEHPIIEFDTIYRKGTWEIMYVFRSEIYNADEIVFKYYQFIDANSEDEFNSNMYEMKKLSLYNTGVTAHYGDELLTLSTCDYTKEDGRFVVVAKRIR